MLDTSRIEQLEAKLNRIASTQQFSRDGSQVSSANGSEPSASASARTLTSADNENVVGFGTMSSFDPFERGMLSTATGNTLLDQFRAKMAPYFPFVIIPESTRIEDLRPARLFLCVATLFASSHEDLDLQRNLARLFEQMVAAKLLEGGFASFDILQGLIVYLAWYCTVEIQIRPKQN